MRHTESYSDRKLEIEQALLELMKERPLADIRINDLAAKLKLVRKTFYHYYPNKMACLESLTDRMLYECDLQLMQTLPENAGLQEQYAGQLRFWMAHRDFLDAIIANRLGDFLIHRAMAHTTREYPDLLKMMNTGSLECDEDVLFFYVTGQISLLLKWCGEGFRLSAEEMAAKVVRLFHEPLRPLKNEE